MNNLRSLFTYCWYLYADYCHILRAVSLRSRGCAWHRAGAQGRLYAHTPGRCRGVGLSDGPRAVPRHADTSAPAELHLQLLHSDLRNTKSTPEPSTEHRFSFLHRELLWILNTDALSATSRQTTAGAGYHSAYL